MNEPCLLSTVLCEYKEKYNEMLSLDKTHLCICERKKEKKPAFCQSVLRSLLNLIDSSVGRFIGFFPVFLNVQVLNEDISKASICVSIKYL